ncbi:MAG: Holliday junction branch migration protein RuvA [Acidimicrobiia bacterium]|nr:Holliday junction branch migration protein RuvA [Acidimicrobiia bacterium]
MIGSLRGTVLERSPTGEALLEVGGVGYRVLVPLGALPALEPGGLVFLFTHHHVRDDAIVLYGFPSREERDTFEVLLAAAGVGPTLALKILSVHGPLALQRAVADQDLDALTLVPGVGKRTAERLLVALRARLDVPVPSSFGDVVDADGRPPTRAQVREALTGLGYGPEEVRETLTRLPETGSVEDLLREALRLLVVAR